MSKKNIVSQVKEIALPITNKLSFELVDVEYISEGSQWYLRVYIDKDKGITVEDCSEVSTELSEKIDEIDPIADAYILEVSSPGLDRPLKTNRDFQKYKGEIVEISLYKAINGNKHFEGELIGLVEENIIILNNKNIELSFSKKDIACVKRKVIF